MKKWFAGAAVAALIAGGAYTATVLSKTDDPSPPALAATVPTVRAGDSVVAEAKVIPVASVELRFPASGTVAEIMVKEGDQVAANTPLARLDTRDRELRVAQAQAELDQANAAYARVTAGSSPEEIAAAQAQITRSEAQLRAAHGNVTASDISAARARLEEARANLAQLQAGPKSTDQQAAQANLDHTTAALASARDSLSAAKSRTEADMLKAANALRDSQDAYNQIYWQNHNARAGLPRGHDLPQEAQDREAAAQRAVQNAEHDLAQAKVAYETARQAEIAGIQSAEADTRASQANLDKLMAGADADRLAAARAQIAQAEADLARLTGEQRSGSVGAAEADVTMAQAELARLTAAPRTAELASAQAAISRAEVALKQAQLTLAQATLVSPIAGTVALVNLKVGEVASADTVAIVAADLTTWQIETTDLTERDVARVREGAPVSITFDGLPDVTIAGTVARIKPRGENLHGDIAYVAVITPKTQDARLRWNMTATVSIAAK